MQEATEQSTEQGASLPVFVRVSGGRLGRPAESPVYQPHDYDPNHRGLKPRLLPRRERRANARARAKAS